jgi:hypothetical protein
MGSCEGEIINTPEHNLVCYDAHDLNSQAHPNQSADELLFSGRNTNQILCLTQDASKGWDFSTCSVETSAADLARGQSRFDCGCSIQGSLCGCDAVSAADLERGCLFEPATCDIVCSTAEAFACTGDLFVALDAGTTTRLYGLDPASSGLALYATTARFGYAALAFNHLDGRLYAISAQNASGDPNPHLVRIDHRGAVTDLGSFPELAGRTWTVGTFLADGTYLIGDAATAPGAFHVVKLRVVPMMPIAVLATRSIPITSSGPSMWAAHPSDGLVYGYQPLDQRLSTFDPATNTLALIGPTMPAIGPNACAGAFEAHGVLALFCNGTGRFDVDVATSAATPVATELALSSASIASCVFTSTSP